MSLTRRPPSPRVRGGGVKANPVPICPVWPQLRSSRAAHPGRSAAQSAKVTLWPRDAAPAPSPPQGTPEEAKAELAAIFARAAGEATPDLSGIPPEFYEFIARPDSPFVDLAPLLLVTVQSIATIARAAPDSTIDPRRFPPERFDQGA